MKAFDEFGRLEHTKNGSDRKPAKKEKKSIFFKTNHSNRTALPNSKIAFISLSELYLTRNDENNRFLTKFLTLLFLKINP